MTEDDNIEKLFRDSFGDFEVQPPAEIKARIDKAIGNRPGRFLFWILGGMLLLTAGVLGFYSYLPASSSVNPQSQGQHNSTSTSASASASKTTHHSIAYSGNQKNKTVSTDVNSSANAAPASTSPPANNSDAKHNSGGSAASSTGQKVGTGKIDPFRKQGSSGTSAITSFNRSRKKSRSTKRTNSASQAATQSSRAAASGEKNNGNTSATTVSKNAVNTGNNGNVTDPESSSTSNSAATQADTTSLANAPASTTPASTPDSTSEKQSESTAEDKSNQQDRKDSNPSKKWLAQIQPGIGFSSASKAAQEVKGAAGFGITAGVYRQFGNKVPLRAGLDVSFNSGSFNWSKDSTTYVTVTHDSLVLVEDTIPHYDTIYYTTTESQTQSTTYRSSFTQFAFGLSTQIDAPLTEKTGFVLTPGFRFAQTKFLQSDGSTVKSGRSQLNLGLDFYYDWKYWRFTLGAGYVHTWMKTTQNPFQATGVSQFMPRLGIGIRF